MRVVIQDDYDKMCKWSQRKSAVPQFSRWENPFAILLFREQTRECASFSEKFTTPVPLTRTVAEFRDSVVVPAWQGPKKKLTKN